MFHQNTYFYRFNLTKRSYEDRINVLNIKTLFNRRLLADLNQPSLLSWNALPITITSCKSVTLFREH